MGFVPLIDSNGTVNDDFIVGSSFVGSATEAIDGLGGDDYILGDSGIVFSAFSGANSFGSAFNIDNSLVWTTDENPFFFNPAIPHVTLYLDGPAGETIFTSVTVGAGETITVDVDFGHNHPIGGSTDVVVQIFDPAQVMVAQNDDGNLLDAGSVSTFDSLLTFTAPAAGTYFVRFLEFPADPFDGGETFLANISVTNHAINPPTAMGDDTLIGNVGDDTIAGQGGVDLLDGGAGADTLFGGSGQDTLLGGSENDILEGGADADSLNGGGGLDTAAYTLSGAGVTVNLLDGTGSGGDATGDTFGAILNVTGSNFADLLTGNFGVNMLRGGVGDDVLVGGFAGDLLDGGAGIDIADYSNSFAAIHINRALNTAGGGDAAGDTLLSVEEIIGTGFSDTIGGSAVADIFNGGGADDLLNGVDGNDTLRGGDGDDEANGGAGADVVNGDVGDDTLTGGSGNDQLFGGLDFDHLSGGSGNDLLDGGVGGDVLNGGSGNDNYRVESSADMIVETAGNGVDRVFARGHFTLVDGVDVERLNTIADAGTTTIHLTGNSIRNVITGNDGNNRLSGFGGNDTIAGRAGNDFLFGGTGNDVMNGGAGLDRYFFDTALDSASNKDTINGFVVADDTIMLDRAIFSAIAATGPLSAAAFRAGAAATDADDRIIYNSATGAIFYDGDGNGAGEQVQFARVTAGMALTRLDFQAFDSSASTARTASESLSAATFRSASDEGSSDMARLEPMDAVQHGMAIHIA